MSRIVLKILGFAVVFLLVMLLLVLLLPIKLVFFTDEQGKIKLHYRILGFVLGKKPKQNKGRAEKIKRILLGNRVSDTDAIKNTAKADGVRTTIKAVLSLVENLLERVSWLVKKLRIHRLYAHIRVAHEDAAVAAIEYGSISTAVYSLAGVIDAKMKVDKEAMDVKVFCDFEQRKPSMTLDVCLSLRILWGVLALFVLLIQNKKNNLYKK